ncbi:MAG TPA: hypothetical protein VKB12_08545 [Pyrinomonadaceae bacterium]|nr:hypothetical protein [Pyrinomonadaceae bacterium]
MTEIPRGYASWLPLLDGFRDGDDSALELMRQGSLEWTSVVAERWTAQVTSAVEARLQSVSKRLQLGLNRSGGDAHAVARTLLDARRALQPLREFASIPCMPEGVGEHLRRELERWARQTQETLEKGAKEIRFDNGRLLKVIRDNPLTAAAAPAPPSHEEGACEAARRPRRVIL